MNKLKLAFIIVLILFILSIGYIGINVYNKYQTNKDNDIYSKGAIFGYGQAIEQVYTEVTQCKEVPITFNNKTITIFSIDCLKDVYQQNEGNQKLKK